MDGNKLEEILKENNYKLNRDVIRRVHWYDYRDNTIVLAGKNKTVVTTEMPIKGVHNVLIIYPNGKSEVKMEFDE